MAARKTVNAETYSDGLTTVVVKEEVKEKEPRVTVFLPALEDTGSAGLVVDQYEHVTISNEEHDETYYVLRGEPVEVPVSVFMVLKEKYPNL